MKEFPALAFSVKITAQKQCQQKQVKSENMAKTKLCIKCGKPFRAVTGQQYCHSPCFPKLKKKFSTACIECGRNMGRSAVHLPENEKICSFCIERHQKERQTAKENSYHKTMTKCRVCGQYSYQIRNTNMCIGCFKKSQNPKIISVIEVKNYVENTNRG
jgi:hypothetical protein